MRVLIGAASAAVLLAGWVYVLIDDPWFTLSVTLLCAAAAGLTWVVVS